MRRTRRTAGGSARLLFVVMVAAASLASAGCTTWRGARLYQSGSRALEAGDVDRALADLGEAARLVPDASEIRNHLGLAWLAAGDPGRALQSFEAAVALDCDNQAAHENLVWLEARLQERAVEHVSRPRPGPPAP